jgi:hypothetical protein
MSDIITIKQNGTDISSSVEWDSLQISLVLTKEISKVQFNIFQKSGGITVNLNDQIDIYQNTVHIFGGVITEKETVIAGGILPQIQITATDWSFKMDTKLVVKTYAAMDPHDIIVDIITNYTDGTYDTSNVAVGNFLIPSIKFNYEPVTKAIQKVASIIGWDWYVDPDKKVYFFLTENVDAPFAIDDTNGNIEWPTIDIDQDLTNMKNSVYVIGGLYTKAFTALTTPDIYLTDGTKQVFTTAYTYDNDGAFTVTLAGVSQTIGIENQISDPSTVQVIFNPSQRYIRFTAGAPTTGQTVKIFGNAKIPILAHTQDSTAISLYGEVQSQIVDKQITTIAEAQARAKAEILQYGHAVYTVKFNTLKPGLGIGQTILLNSVKLGYTNIPLTIKRLTGNGYSSSKIEWQVECYGSDAVTFVDLMSTILQQETNQNTVDDSTILEELQKIDEIINLSDVAIVNENIGPYYWGPGYTPAIKYSLFTWS